MNFLCFLFPYPDHTYIFIKSLKTAEFGFQDQDVFCHTLNVVHFRDRLCLCKCHLDQIELTCESSYSLTKSTSPEFKNITKGRKNDV